MVTCMPALPGSVGFPVVYPDGGRLAHALCSSLQCTSPCAGEKTPHESPHAPGPVGPSAAPPCAVSPSAGVQPALWMGQGGCCVRPRQGHNGSKVTSANVRHSLTAALNAFPFPGLSLQSQTFTPLIHLVKLTPFLKSLDDLLVTV